MAGVWMPFEGEFIPQAKTWTDLRFPAQAINPVGAVSDPTVDTVQTSFPGTLLFSGSQDNMIAGVAQMPHEWYVGSTLHPHIHWMKVTGSASAVTWEFYYRILGGPGTTAGAWVGPVTGTLAQGDQTVTDQQLVTTFGNINLAGYAESCMLAWRIYRRGSSDADSNQVRLLEFDIHYQVEKTGTLGEFS